MTDAPSCEPPPLDAAAWPAAAPAMPAARCPEQAAEAGSLLRHAAPLLRALAAIQCADEPAAGGLASLHDRLARAVVEFSDGCDRAQLRREHMVAARYALCTALDEALSCKPWAGGEHGSVGPWSQYALLQEFHQEGEGGKTLFLLLARLAAQPQAHREVLQVLLHILALGFMGDYRRRVDGRQSLDALRRRLHDLLGATPVVELAPHARPVPAALARRRRPAWWWAPAGALVAMLACLAGWHARLSRQAGELRGQLVSLQVALQVGLQAESGAGLRAWAAAPAAAGFDPRGWLAAAVRAGQLQLSRQQRGWLVRFRSDDMFASASSTLRPQVLPLLQQVAAVLRARGGGVLVVGHTDDTPGGARGAAINPALSLRRAQQVADRLRDLGVAVASLQVQGGGSAQPLADNATPAGRSRNRRVDIWLLDESAPPAGARDG